MNRKSLDTKVKVNNDDCNIKHLHDYIFSDDVMGDGNVDEPILMCTMGSPYHYWMLRTQHPNNRIYAIEDSKLEVTFRYLTSELDCNIVFINDTSNINEWDRCIEEIRKIYIQKENKDMKFRKAAVNPPYGVDKKGSNKMLHWNIFKKLIKVCPEGRISYVCPIKWDRNPNQMFDWVRDEMFRHLSSYKIIDSSLFKNTQIDNGEVAIHNINMLLEKNECGLDDILYYNDDGKCVPKIQFSYIENKIFEIMKSDNEDSIFDNRCLTIERGKLIKKYTGIELKEKIKSIVYKNGYKMYIFISRTPDKKGIIMTKSGYAKGVLLRDDLIDYIYNNNGAEYLLIGADSEEHLNTLMWILRTSKLLHKCVQMNTVSRRTTKSSLSLIPDIDYGEIVSKVETYSKTNNNIDINKIYDTSNNMPTEYALLWYMIYKNNLDNIYTNKDIEKIIKYVNNNDDKLKR
jgi:hypothetical protein